METRDTVGVRIARVSFTLLASIVALLLFSTTAAQAQVTLSINDVSQSEGNSGTTTLTFTVSLSAPALPGGVTFDIATASNSAAAGTDFTQISLTGQSIPTGSSTYAFNVSVNGDTTVEANENFFVNVTNVTNATVADGQGVGTILNDDITITPIHDVQGPGASSPLVLSSVTIRGIVTGVSANGFFVQAPDADVDADPATSEGIFVETSGAPPLAAEFSAFVQVTGTVTEFVPITDVLQPPSTRMSFPTVTQLAGPGQPLPTAITLTATFPDPAGPHDQLERLEHMRVSVGSLTVTGPGGGIVDEINATATSNGRFYGVLAGIGRPFRESGIQAPDPSPSGSIPPIPRWDANPERIGVESAGLTGQPVLTVRSGDAVTSLVGPLDYALRTYTVLPDGTSTPAVTPGPALTTTVSAPAGSEITVASINLRRFFDTTDDPSVADVVLTGAAYNRRLGKASAAIRDHLRNPDIIGVQEAETLGVLSDLAAQILADGGADYEPFLVAGNDAAGMSVGFLLKTGTVAPGVPRVSATSVTQIGASETWTDPATGGTSLLFDRPSLVLEATVNRTAASSFPIVVVVSDLQNLEGIGDIQPAGLTTIGDRVRRKRLAQAQSLANYVQSRQTSNPGEHLVLVGSHNAFQFNDGFVDVMNVIGGTPPADSLTSVPGDGIDLVNPDLVNLVTTQAAAQRYTEVFNGTARNLDHALASAGLVAATTARRIEYARIAADYPETEFGGTTALRFSDRDPLVMYLATTALNVADLSVTKAGAPNPAIVGQNLIYTVTVTNSGPDVAASVTLSDPLPANTTFVSLAAPGGWSCTTPAFGAAGTVSCSTATSGVGSAVFTLVVAIATTVPAGTIVTNTATVSSATDDPSTVNNSATTMTTVGGSADLSITKTGPATIVPGGSIAYTLTVVNAGPSSAAAVMVNDPAPPGLTFLSTAGACVTAFPYALGTLAPGESRSITATFRVPPGYAGANPVINIASVSASTLDASTTNNTATASTLVITTGSGCDVLGDGHPAFVTGAGAGGGPHVRVWNAENGRLTELFGQGFFAYDPAFVGGVQVACRDLTGDGIAEIITGAGPGGGPHVRVWSLSGGRLSELTGFFAYDPAFPGGVAVTAGDLTGDGVSELITGAGPGGGPHVRVWNVAGSGISEIAGFFAYDPVFPGGVAVAAGDLTGDGVAELITGAGPGGGPHVRVWNVGSSGISEIAGFFAYDPVFPGGVAVAAGDLNGDGIAELVTGAGAGGGPHVRVWSLTSSGLTEIAGFFAYDPAFAGGVSIAIGDVDGNGIAELITGAGPGGGPHVRAWSLNGTAFVEVAGFFAYDPAFPGGVHVAR